jgi:serine/threonine protein kinase
MNHFNKSTPTSPLPSPKTLFHYKFEQNSHIEVKIINKIDAGKFFIFLAKSVQTNRDYAMKVFPYQDGKMNNLYLNEKKFMKYKHSNMIDILEAKDEHFITIDTVPVRCSYILMEYAPHKDFLHMLIEKELTLDEKMARTYFHQLIEGLEYLHSQNVYHLDIKLDNLLVSEDFQLKITDFDISYIKDEGTITSRGTKCYRAPELARGRCVKPAQADIYSAGVVLFNLKSSGFIPYSEEKSSRGVDFYPLLKEENPKFWDFHCLYQKKSADFFDDDFKALFLSMIKTDSTQRATLEDVKQSKWYNGPVYTKEEMIQIMKEKYTLIA